MSDRLQEIIDIHQGLDMGENMEWLVAEVIRLRARDTATLKIMLDFDAYVRGQRLTKGPLIDLRNRYLNDVVAADRPFWEGTP